MVIGRVMERHSENVKVDIASAAPATLPMLAFEGATRKNRPNLQVLRHSKCSLLLLMYKYERWGPLSMRAS